MVENFPKLMIDTAPQIQEAQRHQVEWIEKKNYTRVVIFKLQKKNNIEINKDKNYIRCLFRYHKSKTREE